MEIENHFECIYYQRVKIWKWGMHQIVKKVCLIVALYSRNDILDCFKILYLQCFNFTNHLYLYFQVLFALNQTLWKHELSRRLKSDFKYTTEDLIDHYNCGDLNSVIFSHDLSNVPTLVNNTLPPKDLHTAKLIDNYFRMELIDKRNRRMAQRSMSLLKEYPNKSFFFAFGAGWYR